MTRILTELGEWIDQIGAMPLWMIDFGMKGVAVTALVLCALLAMRRASASAKSVVLQIGMVALLSLPLLTQVLPSWRIHDRTPDVPSVVLPSPGAPVVAIEASQSSLPAVVGVALAGRPDVVTFKNATALIAGVWALGCLIAVSRLGASWLGVSLLGLRSTPVDDGPMVDSLNRQKAKLGLSRKVILLTSSRRSMPMTWGTFRPRILLPQASIEWSAEQLDTVLLHELAHIRRADCLAQWITQLACAVHWFNPLLWLAAWRLGVESERATDDMVIECGTRPSDYAKTLLSIVAAVDPAPVPSFAAVAMARSLIVEKRIVTVLDPSVNRKRPTIKLIATAFMVVGLLVVPLAMLEADEENGSQAPDDVEVEVEADSDATTMLESWKATRGKATYRIRVATPVPGIVSRVTAKGGQQVNAGDVLLHLDPTEADGKIALISQELQFANQSLALKMEAVAAATAPVENALKANETGLASASVVREAEKELRQAKSAALLAESELKSAELRHNLAEQERARLTIRAPVKGKVVDILCHPGEYVSPSSPVVMLETVE